MFKDLSLPIARRMRRNRAVSGDPNIFKNYITKQACCSGMPRGSQNYKMVPVLIPSKDPAKFRNGDYDEVLVKITKDDCANLGPESRQAEQGYNLREEGVVTEKCTNFATALCKNLQYLDPKGKKYLRQGPPLDGDVLVDPDDDEDVGKKWNPGEGHFCSCVLGSKKRKELNVQCQDALCAEHGTSGYVFRDNDMRLPCSGTICEQNIIVEDIAAQDVNLNDFMLQQACGNTAPSNRDIPNATLTPPPSGGSNNESGGSNNESGGSNNESGGNFSASQEFNAETGDRESNLFEFDFSLILTS